MASYHRFVSAAVVALVIAWAGLGLSGCSDSSGPSSDGVGTLQLLLVDAPAVEGIEALTIVFSEVLIHQSASAPDNDAAWITLVDETTEEADRTFDLLELVNGVTAVLGEEELEAGHYTQLRAIVASAEVTINGTTYPVFVPSGEQSGLKFVSGFWVHPDVITRLTLDFDASRSLIAVPPGSDNYTLKPTARLVQTTLSGTISGVVSPAGPDRLVIAVADGDTITSTYADSETGAYKLMALLAGTYDVHFSAPGFVTVIESEVAVVAGMDTGEVSVTLTLEP